MNDKKRMCRAYATVVTYQQDDPFPSRIQRHAKSLDRPVDSLLCISDVEQCGSCTYTLPCLRKHPAANHMSYTVVQQILVAAIV